MHQELQLTIHGIVDLLSYKAYGGPHKGGYEIVNYNPMCTYCPLVPKQDTFYVTLQYLNATYTRVFFLTKKSTLPITCLLYTSPSPRDRG